MTRPEPLQQHTSACTSFSSVSCFTMCPDFVMSIALSLSLSLSLSAEEFYNYYYQVMATALLKSISSAETLTLLTLYSQEVQVEQRCEKEDMQEHGIDEAKLGDIQVTALRLRYFLPTLQMKLTQDSPVQRFDFRAYYNNKMFLDLKSKVMLAVRTFKGERLGTIVLQTCHVWVCCRELAIYCGHVFPEHFVPRWPKHIAQARQVVYPFFVEEDPTVSESAVEGLLSQIWAVLRCDPQAPVVVRESGRKRPRTSR